MKEEQRAYGERTTVRSPYVLFQAKRGAWYHAPSYHLHSSRLAMTLTLIDGLLLLVLLFHLLHGWQNGFLIGLLDLLSWVGSLFVAFRFYEAIATWLGPRADLPEAFTRPIAFVLVAMGVSTLLTLLGRALSARLSEGTHTHPINRFLGLLTGGVSGLLVAAILASFLLALPLDGALSTATRDSVGASRLAVLTERLENRLQPIFGDAISQTLNLVTIHPESNETVTLPYTVAEATPAPELEAAMLERINAERAQVGLPPLAMDPELVPVARAHSADMFARGYFSHNTLEGLTPFDRIRAGGVPYRIAGENLAHAATLEIAHNGLMDSPGHRENILRPEFGRVGIGILDGGSRGLMITQNFRD